MGWAPFLRFPSWILKRKTLLPGSFEQDLLGLKDGVDYKGDLRFGLMLTEDGLRFEYNVRFGDPEAQCILPRLKGNIAGLFAVL